MLSQMQKQSSGQASPPRRGIRKHYSSFELGGGRSSSPSFEYASRPGSVRSGNSGSVTSWQRPRSAFNVPIKGGRPQSRPPPRRAVTEIEIEEEEEDDSDWQKMLERRRNLKQQWSASQSAALVNS
jgi:hypothetical protein